MPVHGIRAMLIMVLLIAGGAAPAGEEAARGELITSADPVPVIGAILGKGRPFRGRGHNYSQGSNAGAGIYAFGEDRDACCVGVGIYATVEDAVKAEKYDLNHCADPGGPVEGIGDESTGAGGDLRFRRRNVCIGVHAASREECLKMAKALDQALLRDCPKAKSVPLPEVVRIHLPEKIVAGEHFVCRFEVREKEIDYGLCIDLPGSSRVESLPPASMYSVSLAADQPGNNKREAVLITRGNVIVKVPVTFNVVARAGAPGGGQAGGK